MPDTGTHVVGPEENKPHQMQEISDPSLISSSHPGTSLNQTEINHLDAVSHQAVQLDPPLIMGLGSGTRFH